MTPIPAVSELVASALAWVLSLAGYEVAFDTVLVVVVVVGVIYSHVRRLFNGSRD